MLASFWVLLPSLVTALSPRIAFREREELGALSFVDEGTDRIAFLADEVGSLAFVEGSRVVKTNPQGVQAPAAALPVAAFVVGTIVVLIYGNRGLPVVVSVMIYLGALSSITLTVKWVMATHGFEYPKLISVCHFVTGAIVTGSILAYRKHKQQPVPTPSLHEFCFFILPIALSVVLSIGANNTALVFNSAAFTEIMGSTNALMTMVIVTAMGMPPGLAVVPPALLVSAGCIISTAGEVHFSVKGVLLCLAATFFRSLKVACQQRLLVGETKDKLDPVALLFWISVPSVVAMGLFSLATEGWAPYTQLASTDGAALTGLLVALISSCVNATVLNVAQLFVTKDLGAVGSQLAAQTKMVLVVLGGMVLFSEVVTRTELVGFFIVVVGVFWFSRVEQQIKEKNDSDKAIKSKTNVFA